MKREYPPIYRESRVKAEASGELDKWMENHQANQVCAQSIQDLIATKSAGSKLEPGAAQLALEQWGFERVQLVLANTLVSTGGLGFEQDSLRWAQEVLTPSGNKKRKIRLPSEPENMEFKIHADRSLLAQFLYQTYSEHLESQGMFSAKHCGESHQDYTGKVLVLRPSALADSCRDVKNQLWYGQSGFGLSPTSSGRAVFATCLGDGEKARWNRLDFMGVLDEQYLPDWAQEKLMELRTPAQQQEEPVQEQDTGPAQGGMEMR